MTAHHPKRYGFSSPAHWQQCLLAGFGKAQADGLRMSPFLGNRARRLPSTGSLSAVAADPFGDVLWRERLVGPLAQHDGLAWLDEFQTKHGPYDVGDPAAISRRLLVDRYFVWAFNEEYVARYDRQTLERETPVRVKTFAKAEDARLLDITADGKCGVWCLVREGARWVLVQVNSAGQLVRALDLPPEIIAPNEIAALDGGATVAILAPDDRRLFLVSAATGKLKRAVHLGSLCDQPFFARIASDTAGRLGLALQAEADGVHNWLFYLFDRAGEVTQGPVSFAFLNSGQPIEPVDFALGGGRIWIASSEGLLLADESVASGSEKAAAELLTPVLHSPPVDGAKGWQQAEITIDLPEGASIEVSFAATDDPRLAEEARRIAANDGMPVRSRIGAIWSLMSGATEPPRYVAAGGSEFSGRVDVPLFSSNGEYLVMRMRIDLPPLLPSPVLHGLRILYPERSLMRFLPEVFSTPRGDQKGALRKLVAVIEATSRQIDERIASIGKAIDANTAPEDWLDYLGSWLDLPWHDALHPDSKRCLLRAAAGILAWRGTKRGLELLVRCLAGPGGSVSVRDVMAESGPIVLGGRGASGTPVRGLLAGLRRDAPTLGRRAVLGRTRLGCAGEDLRPLAILEPWIDIAIEGPAEWKARNELLLASVLVNYLPAGVGHSSRWRVTARTEEDAPDALVLEAREPGALGRSVELGRTTIAGRSRPAIGSGPGLNLELR